MATTAAKTVGALMASALCMGGEAGAQTVVDLDTGTGAGATAGTGGVWDFNRTVLWSADGGTNRVAWTDNGQVARINLDTASGWASVTLSVSNDNGQVGVRGLRVVGNLPDWVYTMIQGDALQIGEAGVDYGATNSETYLRMNGPVVLTASQTWRSCNADAIDGGGTVQFNQVLSSAAETTDITLDGAGRCDPGLYDANASRPGFVMNATNAFSGTTTVSGGALLWLNYSSASRESKLDTTRPLILKGGGLWMSGSVSPTQRVASVQVSTGCNIISAKNGSGAFFCGTLLRDGIGGTLDCPVSWAGGVTAYTTTTNIGGILGGWVTQNRTTFAYAGTDGGNAAIGGLSGSQRWTLNAWGANENIQAVGGGVRTSGSVAINSVRVLTNAPMDLGSAVLTVKSGGLLAAAAVGETRLFGGTILSGFETGELFVHTPYDAVIGSVIADNVDTPCRLVKSGLRKLTLTAANTYSGTTYLNSGTLVLTNCAVFSGALVQAGGTTLELRDGGTLSPGGTNACVLGMNGNLTLGDGAVLNLQIGDACDAVCLTNAFAMLTGAVSAGGVTLNLIDGGNIVKQAYPLVVWDSQAATCDVDLSDFKVTMPTSVEGVLRFGEHALEFLVTRRPGRGLWIGIR